jgi:acyl-CoA dehydrogenase
MVELYTMAEALQCFMDRLVVEHVKGNNVVNETCMAKYIVTEQAKKTVDECLQFFGGYGYMLEYPIAKAYQDMRVFLIFAGANEVMKEVVARGLGL